MNAKNPFLVATLALFAVQTTAVAQQPVDSPWSVDASIGLDNSVSGDFLRGAIGTLQGLPVVIDERSWDEVYGTGLLFSVGVGYELRPRVELRAGFTYQGTGADDALLIGLYRGGPLVATFEDYTAWALDFGYRQYLSDRAARWRPYVGGTFGVGGVSDIGADMAQTAANFSVNNADFYDGNAAVTFGGNGGVLYRLTDRVAIDGRLGFRYVSGLSDVEGAAFSGLDDVNNGSSRWTVPLTVGAKIWF